MKDEQLDDALRLIAQQEQSTGARIERHVADIGQQLLGIVR